MSLPVARRVEGLSTTLIRSIHDAAPAGAINLGLGQPDLPSPDPVRTAGIRAIEKNLTGYTATAGEAALREAVARRYAGFAEGGDSVIVTVGSEEAVFLSMMTLLDPDDEVLVPDPGYPVYATIAGILGACPVRYPMRFERGFAVDAGDIEPLLTDRTKLLVLNSPGNPTGGIDGRDDVARIAALAEDRGFSWLSDEVYANFVYEGRAASLAGLSRRGIVVSGLSKELSMTGWRIGWLVAEPGFVRTATALHQHIVTCASSISQQAALAALSERGEPMRRRIVERFRSRRDLALGILERARDIRVGRPAGAFYLFADVSAHGDSMSVCRRLIDRGVITIPGVAFGPRGEGWLRISYAASETDLVRGLAIIAEVLS